MNKGILTAVICSCSLIAGCVTNEGSYWDLNTVSDFNQLNIVFTAGEPRFLQVAAKRNRSGDGWIESGTWQADDEAGKSEVWVYLASLYSKAFNKKHIRDIENLARRVSGDSFVEITGQGRISSNSGPIDYAFYRASGQPCVLIRKYWSDPDLSGDVDQLNATFGWIAGSNFIYARYCRPSGADLQRQDMKLLFNGIKAKAVYWPDDMFVSAGEAF